MHSEAPERICIRHTQDVILWVKVTGQEWDRDHSIIATFIIDIEGKLWIADRHSEHVQCAQGSDVLSAGEITFTVEIQGIAVSAITNQSTGYCPEPESWLSVAAALDNAGIPYPPGFTAAFLFRRCEACGMTNIIKEDVFECGVCQSELPTIWNYRR